MTELEKGTLLIQVLHNQSFSYYECMCQFKFRIQNYPKLCIHVLLLYVDTVKLHYNDCRRDHHVVLFLYKWVPRDWSTSCIINIIKTMLKFISFGAWYTYNGKVVSLVLFIWFPIHVHVLEMLQMVKQYKRDEWAILLQY